jgi:16S rRNA (uracil1498-N3)-methyltransferase
MMKLEIVEGIDTFLARYPESWMLHFSSQSIGAKASEIHTLLIGAEGGFDAQECALVEPERIVGFATPSILRSETAACAAAASILVS